MLAKCRNGGGIHAVGCAQFEFLALLVEHVDRSGCSARQLYGLGNDRGQHILEVEGRIDRLADLAESTKFEHRLFEFAGANFDLGFQVGVRVFELAGHLVELIGEQFEFVTGFDRDALTKIATADACGTGTQCLNRHHHFAHQEHAAKQRQTEGGQQQQGRSRDCCTERRVGLIGEVRTSLHCRLRVACPGSSVAPEAAARAACTWARPERSVFRSTRLMSGCAIRRPSASTT